MTPPYAIAKLDPASFMPIITVYSEDAKVIRAWAEDRGLDRFIIRELEPSYPVGTPRGMWALWWTDFQFPEESVYYNQVRPKSKEYNRAYNLVFDAFRMPK